MQLLHLRLALRYSGSPIALPQPRGVRMVLVDALDDTPCGGAALVSRTCTAPSAIGWRGSA